MKSITILVLALMVVCMHAHADNAKISEPIKDYLDTYSPLGGDNNVYADARLFHLDIDLFNDGHTEVLVSMARNQNGKQGNVWRVYRKSDNGYVQIGGVEFNPSLFYVGPIDNLGKNGLVSFSPGGNGQGTLNAYVLTSGTIQELTLGQVTRDPYTRELKNEDLFDRYFGKTAIKGSVKGEGEIKSIPADELTKKYNVKVQKKTYRDAIQEEWKKNAATTGSKN